MNKKSRILAVLASCAYFWYYMANYREWHFIDYINLIFHEAGHTIFSLFGMFIGIAAGSGLQLALPILISIYFFYNNQKISGALCLLWVGQNLLNISVYAEDAIKMNIPLLGGDSVIHDWNYLLGALGQLSHTLDIANAIYSLGLFTVVVGSVLAIYFSVYFEEK